MFTQINRHYVAIFKANEATILSFRISGTITEVQNQCILFKLKLDNCTGYELR